MANKLIPVLLQILKKEEKKHKNVCIQGYEVMLVKLMKNNKSLCFLFGV